MPQTWSRLFLSLAFCFCASAAAAQNGQARVQRILREVPLIDGHNDLPWQYQKRVANQIEKIDVRAEQELLVSHDVIVSQHPFYWYSSPALLKEWQDLVLEHGWAYGRGGTKLTGKILFNAITAGSES